MTECLTPFAAATLALVASGIVGVIVGWFMYVDGRHAGREQAYQRLDDLIERGAIRWARPEDNVPGMKFIRIDR